MDKLTKLMFGATLKRAGAATEWLEEHADCGLGIQFGVVFPDDFTAIWQCVCGESFRTTIVVNVETQWLPKQ